MNGLTLDIYKQHIKPHIIIDQTHLVADALNHGILDETDIGNLTSENISEWYLVKKCLGEKLAKQGEAVLGSSQGTWWGIRESDKDSMFENMDVIQNIARAFEIELLND